MQLRPLFTLSACAPYVYPPSDFAIMMRVKGEVMREEKSMAARHVHTRSWKGFRDTYIPRFAACFFGLIAIRVWTQCCLYDRYTATDSGAITITGNLARVAFIAALMILFARTPLTPRARKALDFFSVTAMTLAPTLLLVQTEYPALPLALPASTLAGLGIVWGGGMWIAFFDRLDEGESLIYAFACLGASALLGFGLGLLPLVAVFALGLFMPTLSYVLFKQAMDALDARSAIIPEPRRDCVYDGESKALPLRILAGIALLDFALGVARGFPTGTSIVLDPTFQLAHQAIVAALCAGVIWWVLVHGRGLSFGALWWIEVVLMVTGVLLIVALGRPQTGAMLITVSNTFMLGILWYGVYDFCRHSSIPSYMALGAVWVAHLLPREAGRWLIFHFGPDLGQSVLVIAALVCLVALSMAVMLRACQPEARRFFATFGTPDHRKDALRYTVTPEQVDHSSECEEGEKSAAGHSAATQKPSAQSGNAEGVSPSPSAATTFEGDLRERCNNLQARYSLTDRETDMVFYLAQGRSKGFISQKLHLSENTVKGYTRNVYSKLCIHSKQELIDMLNA